MHDENLLIGTDNNWQSKFIRHHKRHQYIADVASPTHNARR